MTHHVQTSTLLMNRAAPDRDSESLANRNLSRRNPTHSIRLL